MLLTVKDVSRLWNVPASTIYVWAKQGKIPCIRLNTLLRFHPDFIADFAASRTTNVPPLPLLLERKFDANQDLDTLIARAKRTAYTARHGETGPKSGLIGKEEHDGARKKK